jgi:hypothetical protein
MTISPSPEARGAPARKGEMITRLPCSGFDAHAKWIRIGPPVAVRYKSKIAPHDVPWTEVKPVIEGIRKP